MSEHEKEKHYLEEWCKLMVEKDWLHSAEVVQNEDGSLRVDMRFKGAVEKVNITCNVEDDKC